MFETRASTFARWDLLNNDRVEIWSFNFLTQFGLLQNFGFECRLQKSFSTTLAQPQSTVLEGFQWGHPLLREGEGLGNSTLSGFQICWSSPQALHSTFQPPLLLISAPYCAGPMGKLTLWRATSAIPNERRIYMIFLPPALGFVLPRKQPTKNVVTFPTIFTS